MANLTDALSIAIADLEEEKVQALVADGLSQGVTPLELIGKLQDGMAEVGRRFETGEFYLSELINAGEIMKSVMGGLEAAMVSDNASYKGVVVIGSVKNDIHDLGKEIVVMLLKGSGYKVVDLGVDVPAQKFVDAALEHNAKLVAMSILLTGCLNFMKDSVAAVKALGSDVKVLIGGAIVDDKVHEFCKADYASTQAGYAIKIADEIYA